jgi:hypothetical protein
MPSIIRAAFLLTRFITSFKFSALKAPVSSSSEKKSSRLSSSRIEEGVSITGSLFSVLLFPFVEWICA